MTSRDTLLFLLAIILGCLFGAIIGAILATQAYAADVGKHPPLSSKAHWYSKHCCDNKDCAPLGYTPKREGNGWRLRNGMFAGPSTFRTSQDGKWHVCIPSTYVRCIYIPNGDT